MTDYLGKVVGDQDPFKKIIAKIPGFQGYLERQARRDADKLLREKIAADFEALWQRISALQKDILNQGGLEYMDDIEAAVVKLRAFIDRVRNATYGHSSLFDAAKINEPELARLYQFDAALLDLEGEVSRALDNLEAAIGSEGLAAAIRSLVAAAATCVETFNKRRDVIMAEAPSSSTDLAPQSIPPAQ